MKKVLLAVIALLAMSQVLLADDYDISGLWYIEGDGFAKEKLLDVVKVQIVRLLNRGYFSGIFQ